MLEDSAYEAVGRIAFVGAKGRKKGKKITCEGGVTFIV
jgi:hypothetical protein